MQSLLRRTLVGRATCLEDCFQLRSGEAKSMTAHGVSHRPGHNALSTLKRMSLLRSCKQKRSVSLKPKLVGAFALGSLGQLVERTKIWNAYPASCVLWTSSRVPSSYPARPRDLVLDRDTLLFMEHLMRSRDTPLSAGGLLRESCPTKIFCKSDGSGLRSKTRRDCRLARILPVCSVCC